MFKKGDIVVVNNKSNNSRMVGREYKLESYNPHNPYYNGECLPIFSRGQLCFEHIDKVENDPQIRCSQN